jgi:toxin CcdB
MPQFDVYKNPSKASSIFYPFLVDIQNNYISDINTRIVIHLGKAENFKNQKMQRL